MPIPNPSTLQQHNQGKAIVPGEGVRIDDRDEKIQQQIMEHMERVCTTLAENFQGEPMLIEMRYCYKETIDAIKDEFVNSGLWTVQKSLEPDPTEKKPEGKVMCLRFSKVEHKQGEFS